MTERFFEDIDPKDILMLTEMRDTERAMADYADMALQYSVVSVEIADCKHPFINLPRIMSENLSDLPQPPQTITAVDLKLNYDREAQKFTTLYAGLRMDNQYSLMFHRIQSRLPNQDNPLFYGTLLNPMGAIAKKTDETQLMTEKEVTAILDAVGVGVPREPQQASWDEIKAILQFAGLWSAKTSNATPLDLVRTVRITDCVEGSSMDSETTTLDSDDGIRSREIIFSLDEAKEPTQPAHATWQITATSSNMHETPCITSMERTPLEFRLPIMEDFGIELLGEMNYVRHELKDQSQPLPFDASYFRIAREIIEAASQLRG